MKNTIQKKRKQQQPIVINNITINIVNETKKKKFPLLKSKNIEDDVGITCTECLDFEFMDKYNNITSKSNLMIEENNQIPKKSLFDLLLLEEDNHDRIIEENINHNKSLFDLMLTGYIEQPKRSLFDLLLEGDYQTPLEIGHEESMIIDSVDGIDKK